MTQKGLEMCSKSHSWQGMDLRSDPSAPLLPAQASLMGPPLPPLTRPISPEGASGNSSAFPGEEKRLRTPKCSPKAQTPSPSPSTRPQTHMCSPTGFTILFQKSNLKFKKTEGTAQGESSESQLLGAGQEVESNPPAPSKKHWLVGLEKLSPPSSGRLTCPWDQSQEALVTGEAPGPLCTLSADPPPSLPSPRALAGPTQDTQDAQHCQVQGQNTQTSSVKSALVLSCHSVSEACE